MTLMVSSGLSIWDTINILTKNALSVLSKTLLNFSSTKKSYFDSGSILQCIAQRCYRIIIAADIQNPKKLAVVDSALSRSLDFTVSRGPSVPCDYIRPCES